MNFDDLLTAKQPPPNRVSKCEGDHEHHLFEGAVMVAYAMHLLRTHNVEKVEIHPDGEHGKQFEFVGWLARRGFRNVSQKGKTSYGGTYEDDSGRQIEIDPKSGLGDVAAKLDEGVVISA
jgi:hypothetical protein